MINISLDLCGDSKHIAPAHAVAFQCICTALISTVRDQPLEQSPAGYKTHTPFFSFTHFCFFPLLFNSMSLAFSLSLTHRHTLSRAITALLVAILCLNTLSGEPKDYTNTVRIIVHVHFVRYICLKAQCVECEHFVSSLKNLWLEAARKISFLNSCSYSEKKYQMVSPFTG